MTTPTQRAWEGLANSMRLYAETKLRFKDVFAVDQEEAVRNQDMAMESKLEKFHALYDVTKNLPGFGYFSHADTSLVIALRNAIHHHEDHQLFQSWNARVFLNGGFKQLSGQKFLLGSTTPEEYPVVVRFYYRLDDFFARLTAIRNGNKLRTMWEHDLQFSAIEKTGADEGYPRTHVYVDVMPAFMAAVRRVRGWLASTGFVPSGFDSETYYEHFGQPALEERLGFKRLQLP